jgi:hypothetical protein
MMINALIVGARSSCGLRSAECGVCADRFSRRFRQVRHDKAVMVGPGRFDGHAAKQRMIEVGRFQP